MFQLETQRLRLLPLGVALLREFTKVREHLHAYLGLEPYDLQLEPGFQKEIESALPDWIEGVTVRPDDYFFRTHWEMIWKQGNFSIGGIGFARMEDPDTVMIGYFVDKRWRSHGIATEACRALTERGIQQDTVDKIIAETPRELIDSQKVLRKCGYEITAENEKTLIWTFR